MSSRKRSVTARGIYIICEQHTVDVVIARDLFPASEQGDEPEHIVSHTYSLEELFELATKKEFREARTIAALYLARDWLATH